MPPKVEEVGDVLFIDGIYIARKACVLICCDRKHVLGWYLCRNEHSGAWRPLMSRISEPEVVVSDGGSGFAKALKSTWKNTKHQRCIFHVFCQVRRYTAHKPKTAAGIKLYSLAKDLFYINSKEESKEWVDRFLDRVLEYQEFLYQKSRDEYGSLRYTHERLIKAKKPINRLLRENTMFTYPDDKLRMEFEMPAINKCYRRRDKPTTKENS